MKSSIDTPQARRDDGWPQRAVTCLLVLVIAFSLLRFAYDGVCRALVGPQHDFAVYYAAGKAIRAGKNPYDVAALRSVFHRPEIQKHGFAYGLYPPFLAVCAILFTFLGFDAAALLWFCLNHVWIILCVAVAPLAFKSLPRAGVWIAAAWIMMNLWPVAFTLDVGNANLLLLAVLMLAFVAHANSRPWSAGGLIAAAAMLKLHPILFAPYALWTRQYRLFVAICVGCCIILGASIAVAGFGVHVSWLQGLRAFAGGGAPKSATTLPQDDSIVHPANQSIAAFWSRLLTRNEHTHAWADKPRLAQWLTLGTCFVLWLATMLACHRGQATPDVRRLEFGSFVALGVVASTQSWEHHYALMFIPFCAALGHIVQARRGWPWLVLLAISYALIAMEYEYHNVAFEQGLLIPLMSIKLLAGVLLLLLLIGMVGVKRETSNVKRKT